MAWTTKAKPKWFINVSKLPDGITVLHALFSCMLFIITHEKNYASIKNGQMRICVVEGDLFKAQKAFISAKQSNFQSDTFSGMFAGWWGHEFKLCMLSGIFLVLSLQLQFSYADCLWGNLATSEAWAGARHLESLWNKSHGAGQRSPLGTIRTF